MPDFLIIPCSIRPGALSPRVAALIASELKARGQAVRSWDLRELPFHGWTTTDQYPPSVELWRNAVRDARAIIWVTPTYHNDLPGVAKSALDLLDARVMRDRLNAVVGASNLTGDPAAVRLGNVVRFIGGRLPFDDLYIANLREVWPRDVADAPEPVATKVSDWVDRLLSQLASFES